MKYMMMVHYLDAPTPRDPEAWRRLSAEEQKSVFAAYQEINQTPGVTSSGQLAPPEEATTVRVKGGQTEAAAGSLAPVKDAINGYLTYEADELDAAIELAAKIPAAWTGGAVEVRPLVDA